ncbi:NAD(P)H-hydrate dehydratase [Hyphobacterium sp.]|uniref:NAD(P)H-hydrate dehydratase n=1 Tax=Hyphobacterium sp. TaxID=2004662 RepID=UPI003BA891D7
MDDHRAADAFAVAHGISGLTLMEKAGAAVAQATSARWSPRKTLVLCGPGNNGGDGFVAARHLADSGWPVDVASLIPDKAYSGDAAQMLSQWNGLRLSFDEIRVDLYELVIDAVFGAGLSRPISQDIAKIAQKLRLGGIPLVSVDLPSGIHGDRGAIAGTKFSQLLGNFAADLTVTFHQPKPAHLLEPSASLCGEIVVADIGIPAGWDEEIEPVAEINSPEIWLASPVSSAADTHKHQKGRLCVVSGAPSQTGAARLASIAGLRSGAGLVTLFSPPAAMQVNALHSTAVMLQRFEDVESFLEALDARRASAVVIGPANGVGEATKTRVIAAASRPASLVLDADALTSFEDDADHLFKHLRTNDVLTPHEGEFARLFPELADGRFNKIDQVRSAAERAGCTVLLKGADTVIAHPERGVRVNVHASPALATAGSGDVLAGMIGGFLAQGHIGFEAACMAAWIHGEAGLRLGAGLIAEDLPDAIPGILQGLIREQRRKAARKALIHGSKHP